MSGDKVPCLTCGKKLVIKDLLRHIHDHIRYYPQKCNDCNFGCINRSDLDQHTYEKDHEGSQCFDPYNQWLVDSINEDSLFAAKHGIEELLKRKGLIALPQSSPTVSRQKQAPPPPPPPPPPQRRAVSPSPQLDSSDDDEEEPVRVVAKPQVPDSAKRRSDTAPNRQPEPATNHQEESDDGESEDEEISKLRKDLTKFAQCFQCRAKVRYNLFDRQAHVRDTHMDDVMDGPTNALKEHYQNELEKRTLAAFPNLVCNFKQCPKCPNHTEIHSTSGRSSHVVNIHYYYLKHLQCPKTPCPFTHPNPTTFISHLADKHGIVKKQWKLFSSDSRKDKEFLSKYEEQRRKINTISSLLFAVDFPGWYLDEMKKKRKSRGDAEDDDEDETERAELAAMVAAAPSRPTGPPRAAPKRRRSPSVSSSDEDEDEPTSSNRTKSAAAKKRASDKEEGEVTEQEEMEEGSSSGATVASGGAKSGDEAKRESDEQVKTEEEIKQERPDTPTTPRVRATSFTGNVVTAPAQNHFSSPPTFHHRLRRGSDEGSNGGGRGRGRWTPREGNVGRGRAGFNQRGGYGSGGGAYRRHY